jgi:hypothetical protein
MFSSPQSAGNHISYFRQDAKPKPFQCVLTEEDDDAQARGTVLRTYRLAVAATGEYTRFHGGKVASALAAIVTTINRVNAVYEQELSIRLRLVKDQKKIIYTSPSTDPYTNNSPNLQRHSGRLRRQEP